MITTLGLKISRRLIAAVVVADGEIVFSRLRFVPLKADVAAKRVADFLEQLGDQFRPQNIAYYAPTTANSLTQHLTQVLDRLARSSQFNLLHVNTLDLFAAFSSVPVRTREQLRARVAVLWPEVAPKNDRVTWRELALSDAAAAAFLGHLQPQLPPP